MRIGRRGTAVPDANAPRRWLETYVSVLSLVVAILAGVLAYQARIRPVPADPTRVPTFGTPAAPAVIGSRVDAVAFFAFVEEYAVRKYVGVRGGGRRRVAAVHAHAVPRSWTTPTLVDRPRIKEFSCPPQTNCSTPPR